MSINAYVVDSISEVRNEHVEIVKREYDHLRDLWFSDVSPKEATLEISVLVGSDYVWRFQEDEVRRGKYDEPVAVKTKLGWVLSGPLEGEKFNFVDHVENITVNHVSWNSQNIFVPEPPTSEEDFHRLWDLDSVGIRPTNDVYTEAIDCIEFTGDRYRIKLPWKVGHKPLSSNYGTCVSRLKGQLTKLRKDPEVLQECDSIIQEQVEKGIVEKVINLESSNSPHYLPHRPVVRREAETTKVRIVYDASCKDRPGGVSLNDCLHVGPSLTPMIFDLLVSWREHRVAMVAVIEKAFLNIEIHPEDRDSLRFLWVDDVYAQNPSILTYRFRTVVFGVNSSPFLLNAVLRHHIEQYQEIDPDFVSKVSKEFYVDDWASGAQDIETAMNLYHKVKLRMLEGGFNLRKWKTNEPELAQMIQKEEDVQKKELGLSKEYDLSYAKTVLDGSETSQVRNKVLGIVWDQSEDNLEFDLSKVACIPQDAKVTKRAILSSLAKLFNPLGLVSPVMISAKILFQELCLENVGWDDELPTEKREKWDQWSKELHEIGKIVVPRCLYNRGTGKVMRCTLHGFGDASLKGYSAVIYLVYETESGTRSQLVCAKTRVAPLKQLSIPRLELMSARILAMLMNAVYVALSSQVRIEEKFYWLDSKTALFWINNKKEWKQFVQHRVNEVLTLSNKAEWRHCPGTDNPADTGSRGISADVLKNSKLWWHGPLWLIKDKSLWPQTLVLDEPSEAQEEKRKTNVLLVTENQKPGVSQVIEIGKYSSLDKLLRITAYVCRFIRNLKAKRTGEEIIVEPLTVPEIMLAERFWIMEVQAELQNESKYNLLVQQLGIEENQGILRCRGRLENADLEMEGKFPIILPRKHRFTELLVRKMHAKVGHEGLRVTLAEVRSKYWITKGRQFVKKVIKPCVVCKKLEGRAYKAPPMAPLPSFRVQAAPPCSKVGVDFAGPLYVKDQKGSMRKTYIALFSCCMTRALHLELVEDLAAHTFVRCLRRFTARRGTPDLIVSDNAKTFKSTSKILKRLFKDKIMQAELRARKITWKFILQRSPSWGGMYERMVGSVKRTLKKVLGNARLSLDEMHTVLVEIEGILNSRPLTYMYEDDCNVEILTPSHLIYGHRLSPIADNIDTSSIDSDDETLFSKRFVYLTKNCLISGIGEGRSIYAI